MLLIFCASEEKVWYNENKIRKRRERKVWWANEAIFNQAWRNRLEQRKKATGKSDIELNAFGRTLARKTAKHLSNLSFDLAITSPLKRAKETAEILLEGREIPLLEDERLAEMGFGCLEGYYCKGEKMNIPDPKFHYFYDDPASYQVRKVERVLKNCLKSKRVSCRSLWEESIWK